MNKESGLQKHLSVKSAWAFSIGTAVGWGSLVVTSNTYLVQSGPMGSVLGLIAGALFMLIIAWNYSYMMRCYPESGGAYTYTREVFGYDQGFLTAWFVAMTYLAILWANATSLPLFGRIFLGGIFRFGKLYTLFGYDVYLGEALLSALSILVVGLICSRFQRFIDILMIALASIFSIGIIICFFAAIFGGGSSHMSPMFTTDSSAISQVVKIAAISPWAFIGFESISGATEEFRFSHNKITRMMIISVIATFIFYVLVTLLSVTAYPDEYGSWFEYLKDLDNLEGIKALPAFYAADYYLGQAGIWILMLTLLSLVLTSLIGNIFALSRLFYTLAKDSIIPEGFTKLNTNGVPSNAVWLVVCISVLVPLIGRTAIGWIVDVTTIGAILIYGLVSAATTSMAKRVGDKVEIWTGRLGLYSMILFGAYILIPNLIMKRSMAKETYFLFIVWAVLGFLFFRNILHRDKEKRFGNSIIVWVALLSLVLFIALIWMRQSMISSNEQMLENIQQHFSDTADNDLARLNDSIYIEEQMDQLDKADNRTMIMAFGMFAFAVIIMLTNHSYMNKRTKENEVLANTDPMTGVKNKHAFIMKENEFNTAISGGVAKDFSVAVCDVNGLKKINDTYGHKAGDEYIRNACSMICDVFAHSPVFRIGGDEFAVILTGRDREVRQSLVQKVHDLSVEHITSGGVVVSVGLSDYDPENDTKLHDVFERADSLMYEEKKLLKSMGAVTRDDESDAAEAAREAAKAKEIAEGMAILNVRKSILIVEDEYINQALLGNVLEEDYNILYASDGIEAVEIMQDKKEDIALVLLDLNLPKMGGLEVLRIIKGDPEMNNIPVIVLTADQDAEVECLREGAVDFIPKPYPEWEIIQARVTKCIELSEGRSIIHSTERDSLTGLFNVDYFNSYLKIYDQHNTDRDMDAIVVDINHFHMINERYGRQYGDSVLKNIGERIKQTVRKLDGLGCHREADTFLIYCPHRDDYKELLEKLSKGIAGDETASDRVRLRLGVYTNVDKSLSSERRFDRAKIAADSVRDNYINPIGIYDAKMHETAIYNERLLEDFKQSLENRDFAVYYQPKFDIRPDTPVLASAEALVRWIHPELGFISPGVFIPLLEENGLILELDKYVWDTAAHQVSQWKKKYNRVIPVSVNVSRIDMLMPDLKIIFRSILDKYELTTNDIVLEITESAYTGDSEQVISMAQDLRSMSMGFRIEMDDFGTGYSSLGMLTNLPIDALKLDMTFVQSAFGEKKDVKIIELIIDIANYLQVPVIAEGVETEEQYLGLKELGCEMVQGYYFSKPVPHEEFEKFLIS